MSCFVFNFQHYDIEILIGTKNWKTCVNSDMNIHIFGYGIHYNDWTLISICYGKNMAC